MERPFFFRLDGLWFGLLLLVGHALGYAIVWSTRRMRWNDFAAIGLMSVGLCVAAVIGVLMDLWYVHSAGFGMFMGTVIFLAIGKDRPDEIEGATRMTRQNNEGANWPSIVVYGTSWCPDCHRSRALLDAHEVPYEYHDAETEGLEELVIRLNEEAGFGPRRRVPTLVVDGVTYSVPSNAELSEVLGLS